jgi:curli production assembly/transport component CsgF
MGRVAVKSLVNVGMSIFALSLPQLAVAVELNYQPVNPSFGGDALNSGHLYQGADIANTYQDDSLDFLLEESTAADLFADALQSSVIAGAASQISNAIFQTGAPTSGIFTLDGATVSYETVGNNVVIRVNDGVKTDVLTIPKPPVSP